jgi:hypothetical protein
MSSECYYVKVASVAGSTVTFDVLTLASGSLDMCETSRSFALVLLSDALTKAHEHLQAQPDYDEAEVERRMAKAHDAALTQELRQFGDEWSFNEGFMNANVERFVKHTAVVERRNNIGEVELSQRWKEIQQQFGGALRASEEPQWLPLLWERCHSYRLQVEVADLRWAQDLEVDTVFGTAAYDVWVED